MYRVIFIIVLIVALLILLKQSSLYNKPKRRILIISAEDRTEKFINYHDVSFRKYAHKWGYEYIRLENCHREESSTTSWCKIHLVKKYLKDGVYDYVMWADSDTIINNKDVSLDKLIDESNEANIIIGKDYNDSDTKCAGLFMIKNSEIGHAFINKSLLIIDERDWCIKNNEVQGNWGGSCYEQGVMNELINSLYNEHTHVDDHKMFLNIVPGGKKFDDSKHKNVIIIHYSGAPADERAEFFTHRMDTE